MDLETYFKIEDLLKEIVYEGKDLDPEKQENRLKAYELFQSIKKVLEMPLNNF